MLILKVNSGKNQNVGGASPFNLLHFIAKLFRAKLCLSIATNQRRIYDQR